MSAKRDFERARAHAQRRDARSLRGLVDDFPRTQTSQFIEDKPLPPPLTPTRKPRRPLPAKTEADRARALSELDPTRITRLETPTRRPGEPIFQQNRSNQGPDRRSLRGRSR